MPQPPTLKINEIFASVQGEGLRQGEPSLFIRMTGCNLRCDFCDTDYAWEQGQDLNSEQILSLINRLHQEYPCLWICVTGGEPLLQDIHHLLQMLKKKKFQIQVETNATQRPVQPVDWYTISPKPDAYHYQTEFIGMANEVKLVVSKELNLAIIQRIRSDFPVDTPILLQPESNLKWSQQKAMHLLEDAVTADLKNIRLSLQMHKVLGIP